MDLNPTTGPTAEELATIAEQCTAADWRRLLTNDKFIEAALHSLQRVAEVASEILGRKISAYPENEN